nr:MAG TPA: hypothetical protein [Caudoviricetes sp.]
MCKQGKHIALMHPAQLEWVGCCRSCRVASKRRMRRGWPATGNPTGGQPFV